MTPAQAADYESARRTDAPRPYALNLDSHHTTTKLEIVMGNIGEEVETREFEPLPEHAPVEAPAPAREPESVPA